MPRLIKSTPKYRKHRASGQAVVALSGQDHYLGPFGTEASRREYDRLVAEWLVNGRQLRTSITITDLIARYFREHVLGHYRKDGKPTKEVANIKVAMRPLRRLFGDTAVDDFGPLKLKAVRQAFVDGDQSRSYVNENVSRIKRLFKWGVAEEAVPPSVYHGLQAVQGLQRGRCAARETEPVRPVPDAWVDAIQAHVSRQVWAIVELQRITGMRSGEVVLMRCADIDMSEDLWVYRPASHKNQHHGHQRVIVLGPRAQAVLRPFLRQDLREYLFSPKAALQERHEEQRRRRKTPVQASQCWRHERRRDRAVRGLRKRAPKEQYTPDSYRRAITRACMDAGVPHWHPHQLRHSYGTRIRRQFGLEGAQVGLGHAKADVTQIYAEANLQVARRIAAEAG